MTRHDERPVYALGDNALTYERLSAAFPGNVLRSTIFHEPPGFRSEPMAHEGEEIFFILEGALTIEIDGARTILEAGELRAFPVDQDACDLEPHHADHDRAAHLHDGRVRRRNADGQGPKQAWPCRAPTAARAHQSQLKIKKGKSS